MGLLEQIAFGTLLLVYCAVVHVGVIAAALPGFGWIDKFLSAERRPKLRIAAFLIYTVLALVLAHTIQIWSWAFCFFFWSDVVDLPDLSIAVYFATVTYTTLGYGDIVLGPDARIFATFCAIAGLLTFAISSAFLIGVVVRIMPNLQPND